MTPTTNHPARQTKNRRSIRLKGYDYSQDGAYFITICAQNRECFFGEIQNGKMILNDAGNIAEKCWQEIPQHYPNVILDEFVIMPNHVHGILVIQNTMRVGVQNFEPLRTHQFQKIIPRSIGSIIRGYKIGVTKWFRDNTDIYVVWQRNYHEHIIRNENELNRIREYIQMNPQNWERDKNNLIIKK